MAGRPILRGMVEQAAQNAVNAGLADPTDDTDSQAEAWIAHEVADGKSIKTIAESFGVSRVLLHEWTGATPERKRLIVVARENSAIALVEDGLDILDKAKPSESSLATSRANFRKWLAGVRDRAGYGSGTEGRTVLNVGELHLHAHQQLRDIRPALEGEVLIELDEKAPALVEKGPAPEDLPAEPD